MTFPYDQGIQKVTFEDEALLATLLPCSKERVSFREQVELVQKAMAAPIASKRLAELSVGKNHILIICSDHTRAVPSKILIPAMLSEIQVGAPNAQVKVLIATGFHRETTRAELVHKFGEELLAKLDVTVHDARDEAHMVFKGIMPSGGELWLNDLVDWADLLVAEGFIEPHFFAGYSGGRKSVLPGIASQKTVFFNHNATFMNDAHARAGILDGNPIHRDMIFASDKAKLAFILNVTLNMEKEITAAFAGDPVQAHLAGCRQVDMDGHVAPVIGDVVWTSNGGYPLDQNLYQTVKCLSTAETCVREGGIIVAFSGCRNGHGSEGFCKLFFENDGDPIRVEKQILGIAREQTLPDQWQAQVLARVMKKARVIIVSDESNRELIEKFGMIFARNAEQAMTMAQNMVGQAAQHIAIPDGVTVIIKDK